MSFDINIHAKTMRIVKFWPGNGNSLRLQFVSLYWQASKTSDIDVYLEDSARAWDLYDLLKDERTKLVLQDGESEADFRALALKEREARIAREEATANGEFVDETPLEEEFPF
ncbi:MAG TPA: hypothetical protein DDZ20_10585 [Hyphomonas sp.]|nr:MAG: hypothetical protein GOVbin52_82 [Prokaryotic dsDNA virus sp.]HBJ41173.1 hypothetical protein [Hyphomonas sp.]|tara:strand:- start:6487 stop:6825 length:339 start_codon:yes stop_codon:yes gene_type:complete